MSHSHSFNLDDNGSTNTLGISGRIICAAVGDFDGGTLQFQYSPDEGVTWIDLTDGDLTAAGVFECAAGTGGCLRATLSGSTSPDIDVSFSRIPS